MNSDSILSRFIGSAASVRTMDRLMADCAHHARHLIEVDAVDIVLVDGQTLTLAASTIAPEFVHRLRIARNVGIAGEVVKSRERVVIKKNVRKDPRFRTFPGFEEAELESAVIEPLIYEDVVQGAIFFRRALPWSPKKSELELTRQIGESLALAISSFRNAYELGSHVSQRIGAVNQVTEIIARSPYLEEILQLLVNMTAQQFQYRVCTVRLLDEQNSELVLRATQATVKAYQRKRSIKLGESIAGRVIVQKATIIVEDVQADPEYIGHDLAVEQGLRSMICVPLLIQDRAVGVMTCYTDQVRRFDEDEIKALETIAKQAAVSIEHAKLQVRHTLMQEMHHRVKNNLQQVVSLLRLQMRHKSYKNTEQAINDSLSRILAIAAVHDLLSREDLDHVGIKSIAESLVHHQQQSFIPPETHIRFVVRGEDVRLNMTQATQVALTLNELIQNSVEHGFTDMTEGEIHITIETDEEQVGVWVSNNGTSLPPAFNASSADSLGLQIVGSLARALGGNFSIEDRLGWTVNEVKFSRQMSE